MKNLSILIASLTVLSAGSLTRNAVGAAHSSVAAPAQAVQTPRRAAEYAAYIQREKAFQKLLEAQGLLFLNRGYTKEQIKEQAKKAWITFFSEENEKAREAKELRQEQDFAVAFHKSRKERETAELRADKARKMRRQDAYLELFTGDMHGTLTQHRERELRAIIYPTLEQRKPALPAGATALPPRPQTASAHLRLPTATRALPLIVPAPRSATPAAPAVATSTRSTSPVRLPALGASRAPQATAAP